MRALVSDARGGLALRDVHVPRTDGECLVRVVRAGICGTDLQMLDGYAGFTGTLGHEFAGVVEEAADPADAAWVGTRVVGEINVGCGRCGWCRNGIKEHCEDRSVLGIRGRDGAFADYVTLPAANLHEVPAAVDDDAAIFVEPIAAAFRILEQVPLAAEDHAAVLGDGRMGLLVAQVLRTRTAHVTLVGRHDDKLAIAESLGITSRREDAGDAPRGRFDVVVEVTGRAAGLGRALDLVRPRGTVVMKSTFHGEAALPPWPIVVHEVSLVGSRCGPFAPALAALARGDISVRPLISHVAPLEDFAAAFARARSSLKVLFAI